MPLQNRVTPFGHIIAHPARGLFMGNRGRLHDDRQTLASQGWRSRLWITCLTSFKDRRRPLMRPGHYTELFFLDEATALAAGHRPCAECRRADYRAFRDAITTALALPAPPRAADLDRLLHAARIDPATRQRRTWRADLSTLPPGTMVVRDGQPDTAWLLGPTGPCPWSPDGYGPAQGFTGAVTVLTPEPTVAALRQGYRPVLHPTAMTSYVGLAATRPRNPTPSRHFRIRKPQTGSSTPP
ncbi:hypothetical protein [Aerophototrophica crusticola]|uniref:hypothetical protein n=1 Tax=Aerophototrophica crusticola TaxID=1709002 RepID=UPI000951AD64